MIFSISLTWPRRAAAIAVICLALAGCSRTLAPPMRYYLLNPLDPSEFTVESEQPERPLSVSVASLRLPRHLERTQIVTRSTGNRLEIAEHSRWGGSLRNNILQVLARNLSILIPTSDVTVAPRLSRLPPDVILEVDVLRFERDAKRRVRLSAFWRLFGGRHRKVLESRVSEMTSPPVAASDTMETTVSAMSGLLGELSRHIAATIRRQTGVPQANDQTL